jgi:alkanesulfonate monooxygenase SsuD/methylene tetrahydromethanopterin reductase-like flavin-dependent oxidoreductase (luciferase family)
MEAGAHLPQIDFSGDGLLARRLVETVETARRCGFAAVSVNDRFAFSLPWSDGLTLLARASEHSGEMDLVTTVALPTLRGPVPVASALATVDALSAGRVVAGVGAGSSPADYEVLGVPFEERWARLDDSIAVLKSLLQDGLPYAGSGFYSVPEAWPLPRPPGGIPVWVGSWGSAAGLHRVARLADGWLASAYHTDPDGFAGDLEFLQAELAGRGRSPNAFPHALATMWTWVTDSRTDADRVLTDIIGPLVKRDPETLRGRLCVGSAQACAELLSRYARAGCRRVHFWPVGDECRQLELIASEVLPQVAP